MKTNNTIRKTVLVMLLLAIAAPHNVRAAETIAGDWTGHRGFAPVAPDTAIYNWEKDEWNFPYEKKYASFFFDEKFSMSGTDQFMRIVEKLRSFAMPKDSGFHEDIWRGTFDFPTKQLRVEFMEPPLVLTYTQEGAFEYLKGSTDKFMSVGPKSLTFWEFRRPYNGVPLKAAPAVTFSAAKLDTVAIDFASDWKTTRDDKARLITSVSPDNFARLFLKFTTYKEYDPLQDNMVKEIFPPLFPALSDVKELDTKHDVFRNGLGFRIVTYSAKLNGKLVDITVEFAKTPTEDDAPTVLLIRCVPKGTAKYNSTIEKISQSLRKLPK